MTSRYLRLIILILITGAVIETPASGKDADNLDVVNDIHEGPCSGEKELATR